MRLCAEKPTSHNLAEAAIHAAQYQAEVGKSMLEINPTIVRNISIPRTDSDSFSNFPVGLKSASIRYPPIRSGYANSSLALLRIQYSIVINFNRKVT